MPWQELADLPFAAALQAHRGRLQPRGDYDCEHFDDEASRMPARRTAASLSARSPA